MPPIDPRNIEVVDPSLAAVFREKSMAERVRIISEANLTARAMIAAGARVAHPEWDEQQVADEVYRRIARGPAEPAPARGRDA